MKIKDVKFRRNFMRENDGGIKEKKIINLLGNWKNLIVIVNKI